MSHPTESPGTAVPGNASPDVLRQIAELTDAVNKLVQAQQSAPSTSRLSPVADIGGEIPGGSALLPGVDYSKLSPLQQITLGLRDAKPVGVAQPEVLHADAGTSSQGAD